MKRRVLSVFLALCMMVSVMSAMTVTASAATTNTATAADGGEVAIFPGNTLNISQGAYGSYSHSKQNAFDLVGNTNYYAPFTGTIKIASSQYNAVLLQSKNKVHWANGTYDKMTILFVHDNDISNLQNGATIKQGEIFYQPGTKDPTGKTSGSHVHIAVFKGTVSSVTSFSGNVLPNDALYLTTSTSITKNGGYTWRTYSPVPSTLKVSFSSTSLSTTQGSKLGLTGKITSNYTLTNITGEILRSDGTIALSAFDYPTSTSWDLAKSNINTSPLLGKVTAGSYTLKITAADAYGKKVSASIPLKITGSGVQTIPNGTYYIATALNTNYVLDLTGGSSSNGANIQLYKNAFIDNQSFNVKYLGNGYYEISSVKSGKMLDVASAGKKNGTNVQQYTRNNSDAQKWTIKDAGNGYYYIVSKCNGLNLDVSGAKVANKTNIQMYTNNASNAQKWKFIPVSTLNINLTSYPTSIKKGSYYGLRGTISSNYKLTKVQGSVLDSKGKNALPVTVDTPTGTSLNIQNSNLNNKLTFNKLAVGTYTMKVVATDASGKSVTWSKTFKVTK